MDRLLFPRLRLTGCQEFNRVPNSANGFGRAVGDFATKFLFKRHNELDRVKAISAEIDEVGVVRNLVRLYVQMLRDDFFDSRAHVGRFSDCAAWQDEKGKKPHPQRTPVHRFHPWNDAH